MRTYFGAYTLKLIKNKGSSVFFEPNFANLRFYFGCMKIYENLINRFSIQRRIVPEYRIFYCNGLHVNISKDIYCKIS